ncbi:MAG: hypothetical protein K2I00_02060 [Ruminococcus sp.]|nr:hypothetical protein [Ruminococcus sp.]
MWRLILGVAGVLLAGTAVATVCYVIGKINKQKIQEQMIKEGFSNMMVTSINKSSNEVKLSDLDSDMEIIIKGDDGVSNEIYEDQVIYA